MRVILLPSKCTVVSYPKTRPSKPTILLALPGSKRNIKNIVHFHRCEYYTSTLRDGVRGTFVTIQMHSALVRGKAVHLNMFLQRLSLELA